MKIMSEESKINVFNCFVILNSIFNKEKNMKASRSWIFNKRVKFFLNIKLHKHLKFYHAKTYNAIYWKIEKASSRWKKIPTNSCYNKIDIKKQNKNNG